MVLFKLPHYQGPVAAFVKSIVEQNSWYYLLGA